MNRIGRIAIGGIIEMTATKGAKCRAHERQEPDREPEDKADQRRDAEPQHEALQACRGIGPQHVLAGAPVGFEGQRVEWSPAISRDRRQELVVGIGGAPLRRCRPRR